MQRYGILLLTLLTVFNLDISNAKNIGCLFSDTVCDLSTEWCFDDYAFGRCLPLYEKVKDGDLYRHDLETEELHRLEEKMQRLFVLGYRWGHAYTQCVLQGELEAARTRTEVDLSLCKGEMDQDLEDALRAIESEELENVAPGDLAIVKFTPSQNDPHSNFADEVYYPPVGEQKDNRRDLSMIGLPQPAPEMEDMPRGPSNIQEPQEILERPEVFIPDDDRASNYISQPGVDSNYMSDDGNRNYIPNEPFGPYVDVEEYPTPYDSTGRANPVYGKRSGDTGSRSQLADLALLLNDLRLLEEAEEEEKDTRNASDIDQSKKTADDMAKEEFQEGPATPMYTEAGLQIIPEISENEDVLKNLEEVLQKNNAGNIGLSQYLSMNDFAPTNAEIGPQKPLDDRTESLLLNELGALAMEESPDYGFSPNDIRSAAGISPDYPDYGGDYQILGDYPDYDERNKLPLLQFVKKDEEAALGGGDYLDDDYNEEDWSFKRPERLDVKKPGPFFKSVNNYAFDYDDEARNADLITENLLSRLVQGAARSQGNGGRRAAESQRISESIVPDLLLADEGLVESPEDYENSESNLKVGGKLSDLQISKKKISEDKEKEEVKEEEETLATITPPHQPNPGPFVHIFISGKLSNRGQAENVTRLIMRAAGLSDQYLTDVSLEENKIRFRVLDNPHGLTATDVAKTTEDLRGEIFDHLGVRISSAGVGDKSQLRAVVFNSEEGRLLAAAAVVCGVIAALLVAATVLYFLRRHAKSKAKLQGLSSHDTEASKDYQELCRARMASKTQDKSDPGHASAQRVQSLTKDGDNGNNSPSSRSSTSSCEEPVAPNMDISTGHMVLSYMEDHLKNKDRLEQEWIALCAYEAEPCATTFALKADNKKKNRYPDLLPYDHNRVILNEATNLSESDYINASPITDHDPRNPAYIATQGALGVTAGDFWQMVWEQGSVVIVMLSRLTEAGHSLCHRYWPEEGSELYHIYEVHLVSEHIWCDDYLVRSFYLKNIRTGETRTVTQFHFLSWPDTATPVSTKALLEFRRKVNKSYRGRSCPIIVHCSDGAGRTGTYCLIDMVLNRMAKGTKEIDIAATLEHIRDQRPDMVRNKAQFEFVLMAVAEEVHAILKALPQ